MNSKDPRVKAPIFPLYSFILSFLVLGALTTGQMMILQNYLDLTSIPREYIVFVVIYWIIAAAAFTLLTRYQFVKRYHKPMEEFAKAIRKVARGDFSVYVSPRHLKNKLDYLDAICMDFNVMVEELGSIETLKTDFFSNVSHEIKTPLSIIQNYAQALKNEKLTPEQRAGYIDTIQDSSSRLNELITNILKLNKLEKQNLQPITEAYDLCAQLCDSALLFEELWTRKNIEFIADIEDRATIEADSSLLELIWNNLLSNAIKFTEPGGTVILQQSSTDEEVIVSISDTGCGMSEETMKYIFDKFYQGDTSHSTEGNGLGLALVLRVLQLIGGSITVASVPAHKTTFTVRIPVRHKAAEEG